MTDRVVKVSLVMQASGYIAGAEQAASKTRELGSEAEKLTQKKQAFETLGRASLAAGAAIGVGVGMAISKFAEFDQQMSYVQAATHETTANMNLLRDAALEAGARTVFSATEAAAAIEELSKAGVSTRDILSGGLDAALDLAAAGGLGVADAAGIASIALKTFGLQGRDMSHVADLLAAGAGKAMGDVSDLSAALAQGGQVAKQTGLSIDETTAGLAAFAAQGLLGSDAGTSFKSMLQRLTPQSNEARQKMRELGISAYDANGQFIGLAKFAGNLQQALKDLTPEQRNSALATIFGSDAVRAASVLYSEGEVGIRDWIKAVDDQGYASETAAIRLNNLKGDWEALTGAIDTAMISSGEAANGPLRLLVQTLTGMVGTFNDLPAGGQQAVFWIGAVGTAVALTSGAFLVGVPKVAEYRNALAELGPTAQRTSRLVGTAMKGLGLTVAIAASLELAKIWRDQLQPTAEQLSNALKTASSAQELFNKSTVAWTPFDIKPMVANVDEFHRALQIANTEASGFFGWLGANTTFDQGNKAFGTLRDGWQSLGREMAKAPETIAPTFAKLRTEFSATDDELSRLIEMSPELKAALTDQATQTGLTASAQNLLMLATKSTVDVTKSNASALDALAGKAHSASIDISELADTIRGFGSASLDTRSAARDFEAALDDLQEKINDNGATLDITTEKGRDNEKALDDLATSTTALAAATVVQTGNQEDANRIIADGRQRLIEMLAQFGITGQAAEDYADQLGLVPRNVDTAVNLYTDTATAEMREWLSAWQGKTVTIDAVLSQRADGWMFAPRSNFAGGLYERAKPKEFFTGGFPSGIYAGAMGGIHKFAEERLPWETYISPDPAYRRENQALVLETGRRLGMWETAPTSYGNQYPSATSPTLDGAAITGRLALDADGFVSLIDGRIRLADDGNDRALSQGWQVR